MKNQKGFVNIGIILAVVAVIVVGGYFVLMKPGNVVAPTETPTATNTTSTPTASPTKLGESVICTQDAKLCPDGSYVGRTGPKCEFKTCPEIKLTGYTNAKYKFSFQYPADWQAKVSNEENFVFYKTGSDARNIIFLSVEDNANKLSLDQWLKLKGFQGGYAVESYSGGSVARVTSAGAVASINVFFQLDNKVVHFLISQNSDYLDIFNKLIASFKLTQ